MCEFPLQLVDAMAVDLARRDDPHREDEQRAFVRIEVWVVAHRALDLDDQRPLHVAVAAKHVPVEAVGVREDADAAPFRLGDLTAAAAGRALPLELHVAMTDLAARIRLRAARRAAERRAAAAAALVAAALVGAAPRLRDLVFRLQQLLRALVARMQPPIRLHAPEVSRTGPYVT